MNKKCGRRIYVLGYIGKIVKSDANGSYYVDFTNKNKKHWEIVSLLRHRLNKIYYKNYNVLSYLVDKLNLKSFYGNFPEFDTIKELKIFVNYLNKLNLIFIK